MKSNCSIDEVLIVVNQILIRCTVLGFLVLTFWWLAMTCFGDLTFSVHTQFIELSRGQFNAIHYTGMLTTKAVVSMLFFLPWVAIRMVLKKRTDR